MSDAQKDCVGCKWWSEMMAQSVAGGPLEAICLNSDNKILFGKYSHSGCEQKERGGSVDAPSDRYMSPSQK